MLVAVAGLAVIAISVRALKPEISIPQLLFIRAFIGLVVITPFALSKGWKGLISCNPGLQITRNITHVAAQYCVFFAIITVPLAARRDKFFVSLPTMRDSITGCETTLTLSMTIMVTPQSTDVKIAEHACSTRSRISPIRSLSSAVI